MYGGVLAAQTIKDRAAGLGRAALNMLKKAASELNPGCNVSVRGPRLCMYVCMCT